MTCESMFPAADLTLNIIIYWLFSSFTSRNWKGKLVEGGLTSCMKEWLDVWWYSEVTNCYKSKLRDWSHTFSWCSHITHKEMSLNLTLESIQSHPWVHPISPLSPSCCRSRCLRPWTQHWGWRRCRPAHTSAPAESAPRWVPPPPRCWRTRWASTRCPAEVRCFSSESL